MSAHRELMDRLQLGTDWGSAEENAEERAMDVALLAAYRNEVLDEALASLGTAKTGSDMAVTSGLAIGERAQAFNRGLTFAVNRVTGMKTEMS